MTLSALPKTVFPQPVMRDRRVIFLFDKDF